MADKYLTAFIEQLSSMDDEALIRTVVRFKAAPDDYRSESVAAALAEVSRRGLTGEQLSQAETEARQDATASLFDDAIALADEGRTRAEIQAFMKTCGLDESSAREMARRACDRPATQRHQAGRRNMVVGAGVCLGGLLLTGLTYAAAAGPGRGRYVIFWGSVVAGVLQFLRGVRQVRGTTAQSGAAENELA